MRTLFNILIMILTAVMVFCQPLNSDEGLTLYADYAVFYDAAEGYSYVEFYYGLYRDQLGFISSDTLDYSLAGVYVSVLINDESGLAFDSASTYFLVRGEKTADSADSGVRLFDYLPLKLSAGKYRARITAIDNVSKKAARFDLNVTVPAFNETELAISSIELAYEIKTAGEDRTSANQRLVKEDLLVVPNPTGVYRFKEDSIIFTYAEIYGLQVTESGGGQFEVGYTIKDTRGNLAKDFGLIRHKKPGQTSVLTNRLVIGDIEPGDYHLILDLVDLDTKEKAVVEKGFSVLGVSDEGVTLSHEDIELMVRIAWYHLNEVGKAQIKKLNDNGKRNYLRQFWRLMDDDPATPENPFYDEAVRRFVFANQNYSVGGKNDNGWKMDRGRVFITYGPYNEQANLVMPGTADPIIRWTYYNIEGGVIFLFVSDEMALINDYRLKHSTHTHELHNEYWVELLEREAPEEAWRRKDLDSLELDNASWNYDGK